ncbi:MAG: ComF family protein [Ruminococcaceae bacterium]|nr:ComF family protein [Oscillospiraceae bacterium]
MKNTEKRSFLILDLLSRFASWFLKLVCVPKCIVCKDVLLNGGELCPECLAIWSSARGKRCPVCQRTARACKCRPLALVNTDILGERKLSALSFYGKFGSTEEHDLFVRKYVFRVKKSSDRTCVRSAGRELSHEILRTFALAKERVEDWKITYPPRSKSSLKKYGFDQAKDLAEMISHYTGMEVSHAFDNIGKRTQKSLGARERRINAAKSYRLKKSFKPEGNYVVVDDVITTGSTVNSVATILKENGAQKVFPLCIARTKMKKRKVRRPSERPWFNSVKR